MAAAPRMAIRNDGGPRTPLFYRPRHNGDHTPWEDDRTKARFSHDQVVEKTRKAELVRWSDKY